jgi:D-alanyl-D-alanine carboxypeptidase
LTEPIGEEGFVDLMNINAKNLGLKNTRFFNPTGLEPDGPNEPINHSTVGDLVKLAKYILKNYPQIFKITANQSYTILKPNGAVHHFIPENTNELLGKVPGIIGGKTGWSPKASGCLLLVLKNPKGNGYFVTVVLGSNDRFGDMKKIIEALGIKLL